MYGLVDDKNRPVAFHREKRIITKYMEGYKKSNNILLKPIHIKRKKLKNYYGYEDLYLVRYGSIYIQSKYLYIRQLDVEPLLTDLECAHDVIIRIIEFSGSKSDCKSLSKALNIIDKEIEKYEHEYTCLQELEERNQNYAEYSRNGLETINYDYRV